MELELENMKHTITSLNSSPLTLTILFKKWSFPGMLLALIGGCKCALSLATRRGYTSL